MPLTKIKTSGIADDAVTTEQIAHSTITDTNLADDSCTQAKIADDAVDGARLEDNSVTLAKMAGGTDGQIITYDASGDPVAVGPGTDGQVLTSTGAGSPPAFEAIPASDSIVEGNSTAEVLDTGSNGIFRFLPEGSEVFRISTTGEVGIGTDNPSDNLHLAESGATNSFIRFSNSNISDGWSVGARGSDGRFQVTHNGVRDSFAIDTSGNATIPSGNLVIGTSGKGVDFSAAGNAAGMTSELLDDYEEGTWTPGISFGGGTTGITYNTSGSGATGGKYTKIGNQVTVSGNIVLTSKGSAGGAARITGLPFTDGSTADAGRSSGSIGRIGNFSTGSPMQLLTGIGVSTIRIRRIETDWDDSEDVNNNDFTDTTYFFFSMTYFA